MHFKRFTYISSVSKASYKHFLLTTVDYKMVSMLLSSCEFWKILYITANFMSQIVPINNSYFILECCRPNVVLVYIVKVLWVTIIALARIIRLFEVHFGLCIYAVFSNCYKQSNLITKSSIILSNIVICLTTVFYTPECVGKFSSLPFYCYCQLELPEYVDSNKW